MFKKKLEIDDFPMLVFWKKLRKKEPHWVNFMKLTNGFL
jgi:hypothetical protein